MNRNDADIFRIDRNIIDNFESINSQFRDDAVMVRQIIHYLAYKEQSELFSATDEIAYIDPIQFADFYKLKRPYLLKPHSNPLHLQVLKNDNRLSEYLDKQSKDPNYRIMDNIFENALYRLFSESLFFEQYHEYTPDEISLLPVHLNNKTEVVSTSVKTFSKISFLKSFSVIYQQSAKGQTKIVYGYTLDTDFRKVLSKYYQIIPKDTLISLSKKKLEGLYLFILKNYHHTVAQNGTSTLCSIDTISKYIECDIKNIRDKKKKITQHIKTVLSYMPYVSFEWVKGANCKYAYTICFHYTSPTNHNELDVRKVQKQIIYEDVLYLLAKKFKEMHPNCDKKKISDYIDKICSNVETKSNETAVFHYRFDLQQCFKLSVNDKLNKLQPNTITNYTNKFMDFTNNEKMKVPLKDIIFEVLA